MHHAFFAVLLAFAAVGCHRHSNDAGEQEGKPLDVKYRYLVVEVVGPEEWQKQHEFSIRWRGKDTKLPVVFRFANVGEHFDMGSAGESSGHLEIGKEKAAVTANPDTAFQVRNTGAGALIPEETTRKDAVACSMAGSVFISPPEFPGEMSPDPKKEEVEAAAKRLTRRLKELLDAGRVIDLKPDK